MATTVHIPTPILKSVDEQARRKKVSRNRYIVEALAARLAADRKSDEWPEGFFDDLRKWREDPVRRKTVDGMLAGIKAGRRSKKPVSL